MSETSVWKQRAPLIISSVLVAVTLYFFSWSWSKIFSIIISQYRENNVTYAAIWFGETQKVPFVFVVIFSIVACFSWLLSTRVEFFQKRASRVIVFFLAVFTVWGVLAAYGMTQTRSRIVPFFEERLANVIETSNFFSSIVFEQTQGFYLMVTMLPLIVMLFISLFVLTKYVQHDKELNKPFFEYEWKGKWLQRFAKLENQDYWPDIELGLNDSNEMVVMPGRDRTLNTMIVGAIGTGKTAALALPMLNQDLHHMTHYINRYPELYKREDFNTEKVGGRFMSGISVIDPSNDLCQKTLQLVRAHGIPEEAITYINPLDPNTPSINPMRGPVDKVAEVFALVIAGLNDSKDGGNFFFEQAQRNHLKQYIYLLKQHDVSQEVTFDMLLDMYNNPQMVRRMHLQLKTTFPENYEEIVDRDERNHWKILQGIDEWFDLNLLPKMIRSGPTLIPDVNDDNEQIYYDAKEEHVQGLRNILNDIGANPLIRRVLFGKSDFDFDRHMEIGGVLLVNTAKGELVNLARVLGKIVLMNLQNATFRRKPNISSFHHILIDEAPDYLYNAFREFPAQSRKYKVTITTLKQTIAQLADQFGEHYMTTLIGTMRNRMVYGDVPGFDAEYFSKMFGEKFVYDEGQSEQSVSPLQEDPMSRSGSSYSKVRESSMASSDIMFQEAFECAVKLVVNNKPMPVVQVAANFVPFDEFNEAIVVADEEAAAVWMEQRRMFGIPEEALLENPVILEEEASSFVETKQAVETVPTSSLDTVMIDQALRVVVDAQPRDEVSYKEPVQHRQAQQTVPVSKPTNPPRAHEHVSEPVRVPVKRQPTPAPAMTATIPAVVAEVESIAEVEESFMDGIVSEYKPEEEVVRNTESTEIEPVDERLHGVSEYQESQLNPEQEEFMQQLGDSIQTFPEKENGR